MKAEKTGDGKLKARKRFFQNLTTKFNYHFNANVKLNEVLERAKYMHRDHFDELLSFYNYSIDNTKADSLQLDSIVYKSQTGLVMHDLRSDWTDDLYLLWGTAYYFWDKLDSASMMFQFINYAFAEKEEDGYYIPVGTAKEGQKALSIASEEKPGMFGRTTDRNDAFIWQIRTLTEMKRYAEAAGLINTLRNDPAFPERLHTSLEEMQAYWFYKQQVWDSAAQHLVLALENAGTRQEKARWEYLAAQLFEKAGKIESAKELYAQSIPHTTDPVMDVYARLNLVRLNKNNGDNYIDQNIAELLRMAKRDKYADYRDIIYFMAAQMEMERNNLAAARELLIKGSKYNNGNTEARNKAFLQIADLSYDQRNYTDASSFYDSLQVGLLTDADRDRVNQRRPYLTRIVFNEKVIERQDSLQKIAAMPEDARNDLLTKMAKQIRKERGIKDVPVTYGRANSNNPPPDLFAGAPSKGEWYFYNTTLKTQGQQQFKQVWGNRPNTDNWRRSGNVSQQLAQNQVQTQANAGETNEPEDISAESLAANLPLTPEGLQKSNDSISVALNTLGTIFLNEAEDYQSAIDALEALRARFPAYEKMDEVLFNLYYAYLKIGDTAKANQIKALMEQKFAGSKFTEMAKSGKAASASSNSPQATRDYENIYNQFIEGNFAQAIAAKRIADSTYQTNYWQPQLLYIESVYHIQQRNDSTAKQLLQVLATQENGKPMGEKAKNLLSVLSRRAEIERELNAWQIKNQPDVTPPAEEPAVVAAPVQRQPVVPTQVETTRTTPTNVTAGVVDNKQAVNKPAISDTAMGKQAIAQQPEKPQVDSVKADVAQQVKPEPAKPIADTTQNVVKAEPPAPPKDTVVTRPAPVTTQPAAPQADPDKFYFDPNAQHYAVIVLDKVDPIFVNEARNAFDRFTKESFNGQPLKAEINDITPQTRLVLVGNFPSAQAAIDYVQAAKKLAVSQIVPWLKPEKYSFSIISARNLSLLKKSADWSNYKKFTDEVLPGKF
ncbi:MAG: hypothetical protein ACO1OO_06560 [Flavisolibacter sp.]